MDALNTASLTNLLGFAVGVALYAMLLVMVVRHRRAREKFGYDLLLLATAALGLAWNLTELFALVRRDFAHNDIAPLWEAFAYAALGFLPTVVVHSAWKNSENARVKYLAAAAYALSFFAAILHLRSAIFLGVAPSGLALRILTFGSLALLAGLLVLNFRQTLEKKTVWITALLVFAVSSLHLSGGDEEKSWLVELVAHQSSLPLAFAILFQDYRFAFADLFLKRALSLILLTLAAFGLYVFVAAPLLHFHETHERNDAQAIALILTLWVATALVYPSLHKFAAWLVDKVILRRANYAKLRTDAARAVENFDSAEQILDEICRELSEALTARESSWRELSEGAANLPKINDLNSSAEIFVPTVEPPFYEIRLADFAGGRRLLSDEIETLEAVALIAARRVDALRVTNERYAVRLREREISKLATEAQLSALRAQINPHFLFNALTTVGYLIQTAPEKAFATLMKLTQLLRGALGRTGEFSTLGDELNLIEAYLDIERARFEERLAVRIEVAPELRAARVPSLILQPLVENAVKHGIANSKRGGKVTIAARTEKRGGENYLALTVSDTGAGFAEKQNYGVGLSNIEQRLRNYYGAAASLKVESDEEKGTRAKIEFPVAETNIFEGERKISVPDE